MERYDSYKNSGVKWIGEIPSHWTSRRLRAVVNPLRPITYGIVQAGEKLQQGVPYIRPVDMDNGYIPDCDALPKTSIEIASKYVRSELIEGDLVCSIGPSFGKLGFARSVHVGANLTQGTARVSAGKQVQPGFLFHVLGSSGVNQFWGSVATGATFPALNLKPLGETPVPVPPLHEQEQIVEYLDRKTTLIDSLIEKTVRKIELLKEKRTSLINEVVTKGLNPDVEMKDSGVEWIGEIPSHWGVSKLKYFCDIEYGISPPDTTYNDVGDGVVLVNGPVEYSTTDFGYTRSLKWTTDPKKFTSKDSLLFCLRGSTTGRMNITHMDVSIGRGVCSIRSLENQWFLTYSMFSVRIWIQEQIQGSTFPSVTSDDVNNFEICSPPLHEQEKIVEFLDEQTSIIDSTITTEEKRIELLKEYRQSLISEVVTGKVKVCNHE